MAAGSRRVTLRITLLAAAFIGGAFWAGVGGWLGDGVVKAFWGAPDRSNRFGQFVLLCTLLLGFYAGLKGWTALARRSGVSEQDIRQTLFSNW
jgi:hypothetical protein